MKRKTKFSLLVLSLVLLFILGISTSIEAATKPTDSVNYIRNFSGTADSLWTHVTTDDTNMKNNTNSYSVVNWNSSSQKTSHNMWFRVVNSNNEDRGTVLIPYLQRVEFSSSATHQYLYWLLARRENGCDPATKVKGTWCP